MSKEINGRLSAAARREIRVFISSTFRDLQEERDELVKQIFPQLRRLCESRGVGWGEVDLRWGVPDEAKAEGKLLPLCLQEIEHCRPYFIGLLGERYGWVPETIPQELLETQPWIRRHADKSVTALEILHGVLEDPQMEKQAFFYFRDPAYAAARRGFTEEDLAKLEKLTKLKEDIRKSGFPVSEPFATPKQLGEWVLRDLTAIIEELYPIEDIPSALDRDILDHEAYAASRRTVYIGRQEYMDKLTAHGAGDGPPLVIAGQSGGGKSALLANWTHSWSEKHPETPVLVHFIGAAPDSADWMAMLRRMLGEFQRKFEIKIEIPDQPDALRLAFANALHLVAASGRLVLVLDALNQIEDRDGAPDLLWLPPVIPPNVRMVVSTLPGRSWEDLKKRGWPVMTVEPLTVPEREELIGKYLKRYAKALSPEPCRRIAASPQTCNGLYLSTLLNELRQFGRYEELDRRIGWYLEAGNPVELYGKVIQRWEQDYGQADLVCDNVVRESLVRLWAARRGLSEIELLESLGAVGSPLPHAILSPLYIATGDALVNRSGLLTFAHDFLREAVREVYLPTASHEQGAHRSVADYFKEQPRGPRQLDELPWQWQQSSDWQHLACLLAEPGFFSALWEKDQFELKAYWTQIETRSPLRMEEVYAPVTQQVSRYPDYAWQISVLFDDKGKSESAFQIREGLVRVFRDRGDEANLATAMSGQALILNCRGDPDGAMALHKESERLWRKLGDRHGLQISLGNQAVILYARGDLDGALALHEEEERICHDLGDNEGLEGSLNNRALILVDRGDLDNAMALHKRSERLCRELGNMDGLQLSLGNQALILRIRGDLDGAVALHKEKELICRQLGAKDGIQTSLGNQANILYSRGDLDGAMTLHKECERLCHELENKNGLQLSLGNQAVILRIRGDLDSAMTLQRECERLCREMGNMDGLQRSLGNQATILKDRGDLHGAMRLEKECERLCRELGNKEGLQSSLNDQATIIATRGKLEDAMVLFEETEHLCRELGNKDGLRSSLGNQALILKIRGDLDGAMALHEMEESICREMCNKDGLQRSLHNQAGIQYARGDLDRAMALQKEVEHLCRETESKNGLQASLAGQAAILCARGDLEGALALHKRSESLCRTLANPEGLSIALANQASILHVISGHNSEALRLADEALAIAKRHGYELLMPQFQRIRDSIPAE